jgi:hypothetical protein
MQIGRRRLLLGLGAALVLGAVVLAGLTLITMRYVIAD